MVTSVSGITALTPGTTCGLSPKFQIACIAYAWTWKLLT